MIAGGKHTLQIQNISKHVDYPIDLMARLMYYLHIINDLVDFGIAIKLTKFESRSSISFDEENTILLLASKLKPAIFIQYGVMINDPSLCINSANTLYKITDTSCTFAVTREFAIAGKRVHVAKVMAFKSIWKEKIYDDPIRMYSKRITAILNGTVERMRPKPKYYASYNYQRNQYQYQYQKRSPSQASIPKKSNYYDYNNYKHSPNQYYKNPLIQPSKYSPSQNYHYTNKSPKPNYSTMASKYKYKYDDKKRPYSQMKKHSSYYKSKYDDYDDDDDTSSDSLNISSTSSQSDISSDISQQKYKYNKSPTSQVKKHSTSPKPSPSFYSPKYKKDEKDSHLSPKEKSSFPQKSKLPSINSTKCQKCQLVTNTLVDIKPEYNEEKSAQSFTSCERESKKHSKTCLLI